MQKLAYLPLYVRDFLSDPNVIALTWTQQAIYLRLLMLSWELGPLPDDARELAKQIGLRRRNAHLDVQVVLTRCWVMTTGGVINNRLECERLRVGDMISANKARTEAATAARRQRHDDVTSPQRVQAQAQAQAQAQEEPERSEARVRAPEPLSRSSNRRPPIQIHPSWTGSLPEELTTHGLPDAWDAWRRYRAEKLDPVTQTSGDIAVELFLEHGAEKSARCLREAIAAGWKGFRLVAGEPSAGEGATQFSSKCSRCGTDGGSVQFTQDGTLCLSCVRTRPSQTRALATPET